MKPYRLAAIALLAFTLGDVAAALADVNSGWKAYLASDYATAWRELGPPAEADDARAQYYLGTMYSHGHGVPRDTRLAATWYEKAAGNGVAQYLLAGMYRDGIGVQQDQEIALRWALAAADQGIVGAQYEAGALLAAERGVPNVIQAYKWLEIASRAGYPGAIPLREAVSERLNAAEMAQARALADSWRAR